MGSQAQLLNTLTPALKLTNPVPLEEELRATTSLSGLPGGLHMLSVPPTQTLSFGVPPEAPGLNMRCGEGNHIHPQQDFSVDQILTSHIAWSLATALVSADPTWGSCLTPSAAHQSLETPFFLRLSHQGLQGKLLRATSWTLPT